MKIALEIVKVLLLSVIAFCTIILVIQGFNKKDVYVRGGSLEVDNTVNVSGYVNVNNTVDINLESINGHRNVFFNNPSRGDNSKYYRIPVVTH